MDNKALADKIISTGRFDPVTYAKDNKRITVLPIMHIGPQEFYDRQNGVIKNFSDNGDIIHTEGILRKSADYEAYKGKGIRVSMYETIARHAGVTVQSHDFTNIDYEIHDAVISEMPIFHRVILTMTLIMVKVLVKLYGFFIDNLDDEEFERTQNEFRDKLFTFDSPSKIPDLIKNTLMTYREDIALNAALNSNRNVLMVWGAAHATNFEEKFLVHGFVKEVM